MLSPWHERWRGPEVLRQKFYHVMGKALSGELSCMQAYLLMICSNIIYGSFSKEISFFLPYHLGTNIVNGRSSHLLQIFINF